jgi:anhydro-N-acetylmuramic acid kinase
MIVVAVASGTSADGLDVGVVDLALDGDAVATRVLDTWTEPWPAGLAARLLAVLPPATTTARELAALDTEVGQAVGAAAAAAVARAPGPPALVVSPGQTVHHEVDGDRCLGTLQVGQPAWVVEATGLPVVSDLRTRDVAAGGHGAPLAAVLDALWLAGGTGPRVALNLGGIANVSVVTPDGGTLAWDTGPANCLLDVAAARASDGRLACDVDGAMAARGQVLPGLLDALLAHPHYTLAPPVSTGRETFSAAYLDGLLARHGHPAWDDVLATLVALTATTVADAVRPHRPVDVVASGGGTRNPVLMAALADRLDVPLRTSDELGLPVDGKEVVLWALLGFLTWHGVPVGTAPAGTRPPRVLGRISPGDAPLVLPTPVTAPTRLVIPTPAEERTA